MHTHMQTLLYLKHKQELLKQGSSKGTIIIFLSIQKMTDTEHII